MSAVGRNAPITGPGLLQLKQQGKKIAMVTAYDYIWAALADQAGMDVILVGDSLGMVVQGRATTLSVTIEQMIYHAEIVARAVRRAMVVADLPFPINLASPAEVVRDAGRIMKQTGCHAVKIEGGRDAANVIQALTSTGIATMGHVGLRPQSVHQLGGYRVQRDQDQLVQDALAAEAAGAFALVIECVPAEVAQVVTQALSIPTIGIGAGAACDGQVLVLHDMLGLTPGRPPRFAKQYLDLGQQTLAALQQYAKEVREASFPDADHELK